MTRVEKIDGAPGAGKTHTLKQRLEGEIDGGLGMHDIYWFTFTRAARRDVEAELVELFQDDEAEERARTLHSLALSLAIRAGALDPDAADNLGEAIISPDDASAKGHYRDFCETWGLGFDPHYSDPERLLAGETNTSVSGNLLFAVNDWLRQKQLPPEAWRQAPVDLSIDPDNVPTLLEAWDKYKRQHDPQLYEHGDYLEAAADRGLTPDVDVLFVDEFQDFAPLEYRLYKLWRDAADRVYLAGDPRQSIYSFRGATPVYFHETDTTDEEALTRSYRCPASVARTARRMLEAAPDTTARGFNGRAQNGTVRRTDAQTPSALRDEIRAAGDDIMLLTRTRRQRYRVMEDLKDVGVPFEVLGRASGPWGETMRRWLRFARTYADGASGFSRSVVEATISALPVGGERLDTINNEAMGDFVDRAVVQQMIPEYDSVEAIIRDLRAESWRRDLLANAVATEATPSSVRVGTIHSAKGLEAETVLLFAETTSNLEQQYHRDPAFADEEHRVYYVGASRASRELVFVHDYFDAPLAPPLSAVTAEVVA